METRLAQLEERVGHFAMREMAVEALFAAMAGVAASTFPEKMLRDLFVELRKSVGVTTSAPTAAEAERFGLRMEEQAEQLIDKIQTMAMHLSGKRTKRD